MVAPSATLAHMTQLIMPQHANSLAITFGGQVLLSYPDIVAKLNACIGDPPPPPRLSRANNTATFHAT